MPLNERWRNIKIMISEGHPPDELAGGFQNALERGEDLARAKQTFLNAGYSPQEVESAISKVSSPDFFVTPQQSSTETDLAANIQENQLPSTKQLPQTNQPPTQKKSHKLLFVLLIIFTVITLAGAIVLGVYWDKFFG